MQSQLVCSGCRTILLYPRGAPNVRCAICDTVSPVQPTGLEMDQIICGCCHTLLMYSRGALSVRCLCCRTVNLTNGTPVFWLGGASNQYSTVRCGNCQMTLMYPYRAPSVKCAICQYITNVGTTNGSLSSFNRQNGVSTSSSPTASFPLSQSQTVVVENPLSLDRSGKLVSNVVVGVTQEKISSKHN
ncbi:protein LSD1-like isoform X3 [Amaranthus tricolor]|uniref:protein LSD1-like isoform X3 n=1 Tax=Amaranthus tricolor TaxID=29722 RepID=UPI00258D5522|nr:protein LSD1-like isoform X3 [Amaranthus tricolor]